MPVRVTPLLLYLVYHQNVHHVTFSSEKQQWIAPALLVQRFIHGGEGADVAPQALQVLDTVLRHGVSSEYDWCRAGCRVGAEGVVGADVAPQARQVLPWSQCWAVGCEWSQCWAVGCELSMHKLKLGVR